MANLDSMQEAQLTYLKKKVEDLRDVHKEEKKTHALQLERLKSELDKSKKTNKDREEQINRLKKQRETSDSQTQELKKAIAAVQAENKDLQRALRSVEQERDVLAKRTDPMELKRAIKIAESKNRTNLQEQEKKIKELQQSLAAERQKALTAEARVTEMRTTIENHSMITRETEEKSRQTHQKTISRLDLAEKRFADLQLEGKTSSEEHLTRIEQLENMLRYVSEMYGLLASSTVSKSEHERLEWEVVSLRQVVLRLERRLANSADQVRELAEVARHFQTSNKLLLRELQESESNLQWHTAHAEKWSHSTPTASVDDQIFRDITLFLQQETQASQENQELLLSYLRKQVDFCYENSKLLLGFSSITEQSLAHEQEEAIATKGRLAETEATNSKFSVAMEELKKDIKELSSQKVAHTDKIADLEGKLRESSKRLDDTERRLQTTLSKASEELKKEREISTRLHAANQQSKMAEEGFKAEIDQLSDELAECEKYREGYNAIVEEMRSLVARNVLAEEESDRLSKINAEILGHANPTQKIYYLDRVRKELAETKRKLATSIQDHQATLDEIVHLRDEMKLYKSVAVPFGSKPRTNMTRVKRRPLELHSHNIPAPEDHDDLAQYLPG